MRKIVLVALLPFLILLRTTHGNAQEKLNGSMFKVTRQNQDKELGILAQNDDYQVRVMEIPPRESVPLHYHSKCKDIIVGLSGQALLKQRSRSIQIKKGDVSVIEAKEEHEIINESSEKFIYALIQVGPYDFNKVENSQ